MVDYKKILKSRELRLRILSLLSWVPDKTMVKIQYRIKTGRKLNLKNPQRFTEKLQKYKLEYRDPVMKQCVDKYEVRNYLEKRGYSKILNRLYAVYEKPEDVDLHKLPDRFVVKDTIGGGSNAVLIVDKNNRNYDEKRIEETIKKWLRMKPGKSVSREWPYDFLQHRVIVEEYLEQENKDLDDYKFFCFNGKVEYFYKRSGYAKNHNKGEMSFYSRDKKWLKGVGVDYCDISIAKQELCNNIDEMIVLAEKLSKSFPHVRVDFYNVNGKIIFGELTFFNAGGYMVFKPDSFDFVIGKRFKIGWR